MEEHEGNSLYTAYDATFNKHYSNGWSMMANYTATFANTSGSALPS